MSGPKSDISALRAKWSVVIGILLPSTVWYYQVKQPAVASVSTGIGGRIRMSISGDSPLDQTLNQCPWHCSCGDSMNVPLR